MKVWVWDAGKRHGVTDNPERAKQRAGEQLLRGETARVERAHFLLGSSTIGRYERTGTGWTAVRPWDGPMTWVSIQPPRGEIAS
jgi:hypothetical protein